MKTLPQSRLRSQPKHCVFIANLTLSMLIGSVATAAPILFTGTESYYDLINGSFTWDSARSNAEQMTFLGREGRLVTITSQAENDFLRDNFSHFAAWIGGFHPVGSPGAFQWITAEPFTFTNWAPGEPNGGGTEPFIAMNDNGTWNDFSGAGSGPYLVEYQVPEPTALTLAAVGALLALACRRSSRR